MKDRYDKEHSYNQVKFYLSSYNILPEEARFLLLKVIEQTVRDYTSSRPAVTPSEVQTWENARDFIFDDDYKIQWGDWQLNINEVLEILNIDIDWFRENISRKYQEKDK